MSATPLYDLKAYFSDIAEGDESAFRSVFELYRGRVYGVAFKMLKSEQEAEEIVQDVFLAIWVGRDKLADVSDPEAYLFTIAYNTVYAYLKKTSRREELINKLISRISEIQNSTEETVAHRETQGLINDAVQKLPPQQRIIFQMSKQNDLSYDEIADRMHLSKNTVRNHLAEAVKTVRIFLKKSALMFVW